MRSASSKTSYLLSSTTMDGYKCLDLIFLREDIEATTWKEFILGMSQQEWIHEVESTAVAW